LQNSLKNTKTLLIPYLIIFVIAITLKIIFTKEDIYFFINGLHFPLGDILFPYITELGSSITAVVLPLLLLFVSYRKSLLLATSYIVTFIINVPLKNYFGAPRPKLYFDGTLRPIYYVPNVEVLSNHFSFPSGHTVCAFTAAVVLTYITPNKKFGYLYLLLAILVAYSRMYMSQHFFEDVTAGSFVAVLFTTLWLLWFDTRPFIQTPFWQGSLSRKKIK
jgi:membrane-associated phospholipid phosphatase